MYVILFQEDYGYAIFNKLWSYTAVDYITRMHHLYGRGLGGLFYTLYYSTLIYNNLIHVI